MEDEQLQKLQRIQGNNNISILHQNLRAAGRQDLIEISSIIIDLYELAQSERELEFRERDHHIDTATYPENSEWIRSFFVNPTPRTQSISKVEHEYFLDLLYSISFTLHLALQNYRDLRGVLGQSIALHLKQLEHFLNAVENLFVALDTLAVLIYLTCGLNVVNNRNRPKRPNMIHFSGIGEDFRRSIPVSPYITNFNLTSFDIQANPRLDLLKEFRNTRAHRPFIDWERGMIVGIPDDLSKVKSVCISEHLFTKNIFDFLNESFESVEVIIKDALIGVKNTYVQRLAEDPRIIHQPHAVWETFLAG